MCPKQPWTMPGRCRDNWLAGSSHFMTLGSVCGSYMGVSVNGGTRIAGCFLMENPKIKWMMTGGFPISGNPYV